MKILMQAPSADSHVLTGNMLASDQAGLSDGHLPTWHSWIPPH